MHVKTYPDGRKPIADIFAAYAHLEKRGWIRDIVAFSSAVIDGQTVSLPIVSYRTSQQGKAVWILAGIHGEEPASVHALAESVDALLTLGKKHSVVLFPLCNPLGYARNWRYLDQATYAKEHQGKSVGDSDHMLLNATKTGSRLSQPTSPEAEALVNFMLNLFQSYPPFVTLDLHEDNLLSQGYVYSHGRYGKEDSLAHKIVGILQQAETPIATTGTTRFGEPISRGVIAPVSDGSIDEFLASEQLFVTGEIIQGPHATHVFVVETPAKILSFEERVRMYRLLLKQLPTVLS